MAQNSQKQRGKPRGKGRPFKKGECPNPGGRPKMPDDVKAAFKKLLPDALEVVRAFLKDKKANASVRLRAAEIVIERNMGRVPLPIEGGDKPVVIKIKYDG